MLNLIFALSGSGTGQGGPSLLTSFIPILLIFVIFYFLLIRPQQKKQKQHQTMISAVKKGDKIVTNGGMYGTVADVKEHIIVLRIAENVKIELVKGSIATVVAQKEE
ncbi:MAG TPA: preprotein translocase subunit YajC [Patescibacteria group bacterium]|nr:preprotein translocase subunit YajC [Patescibacteria group bacterium]